MVKQWPGNGVMTCDPDEWFVLAADYIALEARLTDMTREFELLRDCFTQACQISGERRGRIADLEVALREFETFSMIVEPRSHKAEWLTMLTRFRELLNARYATETPPKYGTCRVCGGMGGAHDTTCRHSPAFEAETP